MACMIFSGSCSLCPWCGEERCPHIHDNDNDKRYWVYATDREDSSHVPFGNFDTKEEVVAFIKELADKEWDKRYLVAHDVDTRIVKGHRYMTVDVYTPYVELTITDGKYEWYESVRLLLNVETKEISYYNIWKTSFYACVNKGESRNVEIIKPWDEKLNFVPFKELPWYPTDEEWEAICNKSK